MSMQLKIDVTSNFHCSFYPFDLDIFKILKTITGYC